MGRLGPCWANTGLGIGGWTTTGNPPSAACDVFTDWLDTTVRAEPELRSQRLRQWEEAPEARDGHPREEHLLPLMVCAGAAGDAICEAPFRTRVLQLESLSAQFG